MFFLSCLGAAACSAPPPAESPEIELSFLRDENSRLTRELAEQRQRAMDRAPCEALPSEPAQPSPKSGEPTESRAALVPPLADDLAAASAEPVSVRPSLPIVKLTPHSVEVQGADGISIRESAPSEEARGPEGTRPVLKVQGKHEAWVFHRPLEDDEALSTASEEDMGRVPSPSHSEAKSR